MGFGHFGLRTTVLVFTTVRVRHFTTIRTFTFVTVLRHEYAPVCLYPLWHVIRGAGVVTVEVAVTVGGAGVVTVTVETVGTVTVRTGDGVVVVTVLVGHESFVVAVSDPDTPFVFHCSDTTHVPVPATTGDV